MSIALSAPRTASIDRLRATDAPLWLQIAGIAGFALLTVLLAQAEWRIYLWSVPLTLQTVAVYASGLFLGRRNGAVAMLLYLALGLALPVFSDGGSGIAHLMGLSGGYLAAFPLVAFIAGSITRERRTLGRIVLALVASSLVLFTVGVAWLTLASDLTLWAALVNGWLLFIPFDLTKIALVTALYGGARRASQA
ncbi:MAG: biotin transporter BioY [Rubricoccaceae bacterium]